MARNRGFAPRSADASSEDQGSCFPPRLSEAFGLPEFHPAFSRAARASPFALGACPGVNRGRTPPFGAHLLLIGTETEAMVVERPSAERESAPPPGKRRNRP